MSDVDFKINKIDDTFTIINMAQELIDQSAEKLNAKIDEQGKTSNANL